MKGCVNRLLDGQGGILSVIGDAGFGKSRLMAELHRHFENENLLWLEGRTLSYGQKMSYWPFREILWQYAGITEDDTDTEAWEKFETKIIDLFPADSGEILPYLAGLIGLEVKGDLAKVSSTSTASPWGNRSTSPPVVSSSVSHALVRSSSSSRTSTGRMNLPFSSSSISSPSSIALPLLICGVSRPEAGPLRRA